MAAVCARWKSDESHWAFINTCRGAYWRCQSLLFTRAGASFPAFLVERRNAREHVALLNYDSYKKKNATPNAIYHTRQDANVFRAVQNNEEKILLKKHMCAEVDFILARAQL